MPPDCYVPQLVQGIYKIVNRLEELFPGRLFLGEQDVVTFADSSK